MKQVIKDVGDEGVELRRLALKRSFAAMGLAIGTMLFRGKAAHASARIIKSGVATYPDGTLWCDCTGSGDTCACILNGNN